MYSWSLKNLFKKPYGIGARYFPMRAVGYVFALITMLVKAWEHKQPEPPIFWVSFTIFALVPYLAYILYRFSGSNKKVEIISLILDTFWGGMFIVVMDFSPFPSLMIFLMTCSGNLGVKGFKQFLWGLGAMLLGILFVSLFRQFKVDTYASHFIMILSIAFLAFYTLSFVYITYRSVKRQKILNKQLTEEKQRSEDLLLNILPQHTAQELKENGKVAAQQYNNITVMFTDFVSFTKIAEQMSPATLVLEIDKLYRAFDAIIDKYEIEKIKTIGDSYMCAIGLPKPIENPEQKMVAAALEIIAFMQQEKQNCMQQNKPYFDIRIGMHTGPLVAGVVGTKKFTYDIWGDTVNIASRMESNSNNNKINISEATYKAIVNNYRCTYRGKLQAKNKGEIDMYFVEGEIEL